MKTYLRASEERGNITEWINNSVIYNKFVDKLSFMKFQTNTNKKVDKDDVDHDMVNIEVLNRQTQQLKKELNLTKKLL